MLPIKYVCSHLEKTEGCSVKHVEFPTPVTLHCIRMQNGKKQRGLNEEKVWPAQLHKQHFWRTKSCSARQTASLMDLPFQHGFWSYCIGGLALFQPLMVATIGALKLRHSKKEISVTVLHIWAWLSPKTKAGCTSTALNCSPATHLTPSNIALFVNISKRHKITFNKTI